MYSSLQMTSVELRKAMLSDSELLFNWANEIEVRANSIQTGEISWSYHLSWLSNKLASNNCFIFIGMIDQNPFGQIRFDRLVNTYLIDYSVEYSQRGKGLGTMLINTALSHFVQLIGNSCDFIAYVKPNNFASLHVFEKCGFTNLGTTILNEVVLNEYHKQITP